MLVMGLHLVAGLAGPLVERLLAVEGGPRRRRVIDLALQRGLLKEAGGRLRLTRRGMLRGDEVMADLV